MSQIPEVVSIGILGEKFKRDEILDAIYRTSSILKLSLFSLFLNL